MKILLCNFLFFVNAQHLSKSVNLNFLCENLNIFFEYWNMLFESSIVLHNHTFLEQLQKRNELNRNILHFGGTSESKYIQQKSFTNHILSFRLSFLYSFRSIILADCTVPCKILSSFYLSFLIFFIFRIQ